MPDKSIIIANFKYGLDRRRSELSAQPGVLEVCENGHVNTGGEIEKRKAFVRIANSFKPTLVDGGTNLGVTQGLEVTDIGLVTFGASQSSDVPALPTGVTYQRLVHPANYASPGSTSVPYIASIPFSTNFNGKAFVIATFSDGKTFMYYDAALVYKSVNGVVRSGEADLDSLSIFLQDEINRLDGWLATHAADENGVGQSGAVITKSPKSIYFTPVVTKSSTAGFLGFKLLDQDGANAPATRALAKFVVTQTGSASTWQVSAPATAAGTGSYDLTGGTIAKGANVNASAALIAQAINDNTSYTGYSALSVTDSVLIYAPASFGVVTFNATVTVTGGAGTGASTATGVLLAAVISPSPLEVENTSPKGTSGNAEVAGRAKITAASGTPPYTYVWAEASTGAGNSIAIGSSTASEVTFSKTIAAKTSVTGNFKCTVTDAAAATVVVNVTVTLTRKNIDT